MAVEAVVVGDQRNRGTVDAHNPVPPPVSESVASTNLGNSDDGAAERVASSIEKQLSMLSRDSRNYGTVCIYRVPDKYRNQNQEAYTPRLVSIGLIHYGQSALQGMQEYKLKYLHDFLHTFRVSLKEVAKYVHSQEKMVCDCYEDIYMNNVSKESKEPSEVILLDGVFMIELFLKNHFLGMREKGDIIFDNPLLANDVSHDLLLFENQLPLRFLTTLFDTFVSRNVRKYLDNDAINPPSFNELAQKYFKNVGNTGKLALTSDFSHARHLIEFLSILHTQGKYRASGVRKEVGKKKRKDFSRCPTVTELKAAGVKFRHGTKDCLLNVKFDQEKGILTIPQLTVTDSTETFFRNLVAFEQSGYHSKDITSYIIFLDNLVDTHKDVDLLIKYKIITNELGGSHEVANLFNNLYKEFVKDPREFLYVDQCRQLNDYSRNYWHKGKATFARWYAVFKRDYIATPWSVMSLIAAILLLALTIAQTVLSALQLKQS
ncbi:OLC1v1000406C1 [Oldenlandia corymbosa var. corymbosa]|uniref:OLC1v1000406C1 n=1 Tax=Oldenlandia corymbosa var. corymbosa TaxID=529605 RepID=A0AAV1D501_OLDCO|nr:OLC1v1000406C1 [Oldenlandia corymbosa var. corymbosa]